MKYPSLLSLTCALLICLMTGGCTGFENGPSVSFVKSAKKMNNTWRIREAVQNANDITDQFADDFMTFREDGDFSILDAARVVSFPPFTQTDTLEVLGRGNWDFLDSNTKIELLFTYNYQDPFDSNIIYQEEQYQQWEITRLTDEEFWIKNDSTSYKLEPVSQL